MIPKFRAWDIDGRCMVYQNDNGDEYVWEIGANDVWICYICDGEIPEQILMQSTGLKDENGVEIFEGDIVQSFSNINRISDPHLTETIEPKYKNKIVIFTNGAFVLSDDGKREYGGVLNHYVGSMVKDLEVIGNIYENGELSKQ